MPALSRAWRSFGRGRAGHVAQPCRDMKAEACDAAACARCPAAGEVRMRSIRMGLGAKSTGNGKPVRTRVKRKRSARVSSRIKSTK